MIPVGRYLPGVIPAGGKITIRELLQHRSGLANYTGYPSWTDPGRAMAVYQAARRAAFRGLPGPCSSHRERSGPTPAPTHDPSRSSRGVWTASRPGLSGSWC
ncbi:MAG TPA: serine hydrolase [Streptosporangiaceae bacterium]|nr:serine hydrolase [Streptosporangiaceae bacterium]